jgi:TonB-linked SusC/RagA family outer membrane protein
MQHVTHIGLPRLMLLLVFVLCACGSLFAQGRVSGKITDGEAALPLGGVSVKIKLIDGKILGAFAAKDGSYEIRNVPVGKHEMTVTYIGYKSQNRKIAVVEGQATEENFKMQLDLLLLEEAVVVGYGTKQRRDLTGAVASVKAEEIVSQSVQNVGQALQGRTPGVQIVQSNGMAGSGMSFRVRGVGSIGASSEPLIVVDGIPISRTQIGAASGSVSGSNTDPLSDINPNDIESIDVLKDAAAAAIYGAQGSNGVVIITTKRGKSGSTKASVNYFQGFVQPTRKLPLLNSNEWVDLFREAWRNDSTWRASQGRTMYAFTLPENIPEATARAQNTNWVDLTTRSGNIREANASITGGTEKTQFSAAATYRNEEGYILGNSFERLSGRLTVDQIVSDRVKFGANISLNYNTDNRVPVSFNGGLGAAQSSALPIYPVYNPDGTFANARRSQGLQLNPVAHLSNTSFTGYTLRTLAGVYGSVDIIEGLSLRSSFNIDLTNLRERSFTNSIIQPESRAEDRRVEVTNWSSDTYLTYDTKFGEDHALNVVGGFSVQSLYQRFAGVFASQFPNDFVTNPGAGQNPRGYAGESGSGFVSYFARASYKFLNRYILGGSLRTDGSSRFGPANRFGLFPSASLAWVISDEDFLKNSEALTYLKFRTSYGLTGNASIGDFTWRGDYSFSTQYAGVAGSFPNNLQNSALTWERSTMLDIALDYGLFNDRISGSVGYFSRVSNDLLLDVSVPISSGFRSIKQNVGKVQNSGVEFNIRSFNVSSDVLTWTTDFNITFIRNEVLDVAGLSPDSFDPGPGENRIIIGQPIGVIFTNKSAGVDKQTGEPLWYAKSSSGKFDTVVTERYYVGRDFFNDRQPIGSPYPLFYGGLTNTFNFLGFDLTILFNFSYGNKVYDDAGKNLIGNMNQRWNQMRDITLTRWQKPGDVTTVPRLTLNSDGRPEDRRDRNSDRFVYDASFVRLRNVVIGYSLPKDLIEPLGLSRVRLYVSGTNLLLFSPYPGWDPEITRENANPLEQNLRQGSTFLHPPQARTVLFGINIGF